MGKIAVGGEKNPPDPTLELKIIGGDHSALPPKHQQNLFAMFDKIKLI